MMAPWSGWQSESRRNRIASNGEFVPEDEIATAIAAARGALLIALRLGRGSIAGRAEPSIAVAAARSFLAIEHELRCFGQSRRFGSLYSVGTHEERCLARGCSARRCFASPSFRARQPFGFCRP